MKLVEKVATMGEMKNAYRNFNQKTLIRNRQITLKHITNRGDIKNPCKNFNQKTLRDRQITLKHSISGRRWGEELKMHTKILIRKPYGTD
jgi:hypothetical protein